MARIRRKLKITGDEYNFGGGASSSSAAAAAGGFVKIAKGNMDRNHADFDGFLSNGDTVTITQDIGDAIPTKDQYIYFDNAFETQTGSFSYEFLNGATALPAGISFSQNNDTADTDIGQARFTGTPSVVGKTSFKIKATYPFGSDAEQVELTYVLNFFPADYTPVWSGQLANQVLWKSSDPQTIYVGPTTSAPGVSYTLSNISGFPAGITPLINAATGDVYIGSTGLSMISASAHAFTVTADLGEYGTIAKNVTGNIEYGGFFGAAYFGPGNSKTNPSSSAVVVGNLASHLTATQYNTLWNSSIRSGALRRRWADAASTSPYKMDGDYGLTYNENWDASLNQGTTGHLGPKSSSNTNVASNGWHIKFFWTVPSGVTSFCVVATGAGAHGAYTWANNGGGGGGTAWVNDVTCTPGEIFEVAVGVGQQSKSTNVTNWSGSTWLRRVTAVDYGANEWIVIGYGGGHQNSHVSPLSGRSNPDTTNLQLSTSTYQYNASKDGGIAAASLNYGTRGTNSGGNAVAYPGAGAGGYAGEGADSNNSSYNAPAGGGGGGSGAYHSSTYGNSAGGGVGLDGQGGGGHDGDGSGWGGNLNTSSTNREVDGSASYSYAGGGGSGGSRGCWGQNPHNSHTGIQNRYINGGMHGGGGGGAGTSYGGGAGGMGGIRIIWGFGGEDFDQARAFPSTYTTQDPLIADSKNPEGTL